MTRSIKPVGRINFVLRTLVLTTAAFALEFLVGEYLHLALSNRYFQALQRVTVFGLAGLFLLAVIEGRLLDAGLPRWCRFPAYLIWLLSTSLPVIWPLEGRIGIDLFVLLLIAGCTIPGKPVPAKYAPMGGIAELGEKALASDRKFLGRWFVTPVAFLRSLVTIACFWLPLIWLEDASGQGAGIWIARFGYLILSIVWLRTILGRLDDAGRLPRARYGYLLIGFVLLIRIMLRHPVRNGSPMEWQALLLLNAGPVAFRLSPWLQLVNGYEWLALFLLIQIPLAFLPSSSKSPELLAEIHRREEDLKKRVPCAKTNELALCGPFEYLRIVFVIAGLWIPVIYMDGAFRGTAGSWIARLGYLVLIFFWLTFANGRFEDAGWTRDNSTAQFGLVVSVASLMPLAFHWVNGYGALAIFVLIQTPTALLRSKRVLEEHLPERISSAEPDDCLPDLLGEMLASRTNEAGAVYPERKRTALRASGFGRAKTMPRWRRS